MGHLTYDNINLDYINLIFIHFFLQCVNSNNCELFRLFSVFEEISEAYHTAEDHCRRQDYFG